jgi:hypothetical protein
MVYTQIDTLQAVRPTLMESVKTKSVFADYLYQATIDNYWDGVMVIKPEEDIMQALTQQGIVIEQVEWLNFEKNTSNP